MIRQATEADIPRIVEMSAKFYPHTSYVASGPMCAESVEGLARMLLDHVMLVAEHDGALLGMLGAVAAPSMFNNAVKNAHEVVLWVEPEAQGQGLAKLLMSEALNKARELGCFGFQMMHLASSPPQAAAIYVKSGFHHTETCYTITL